MQVEDVVKKQVCNCLRVNISNSSNIIGHHEEVIYYHK